MNETLQIILIEPKRCNKVNLDQLHIYTANLMGASSEPKRREVNKKIVERIFRHFNQLDTIKNQVKPHIRKMMKFLSSLHHKDIFISIKRK